MKTIRPALLICLITTVAALLLMSCSRHVDNVDDDDRDADTDADADADSDSDADADADSAVDTLPTGADTVSDTTVVHVGDTTSASTGNITDSSTAITDTETQSSVGATSTDDSDTIEDTLTADTAQPTDTATGSAIDSDEIVDTNTGETVIYSCSGNGQTPYTSADILLVVDNSGSMYEEQEMLATAVFTLINALTNPLDSARVPIDDVRIAVTTTDMGVSVNGQPYEDDPNNPYFDSPNVKCSGMGDNGAFVSDYNFSQDVNIQEGVIACDGSAHMCPPGWACQSQDSAGIGVCNDPNGAGEGIECPHSPSSGNLEFVANDRDDKSIAVACLAANVGSDGCNFEQQLKAAEAGLLNSGDGFMRPDSLTAIVVVSDEDDCSIASEQWHELDELKKVTVNLACGRHTDLLVSLEEIKNSYEAAKVAVGGQAEDVVFAAIAGVPTVDACQGTGDMLSECLEVQPGINGSGTVGAPDEVTRVTTAGVEQYYFEDACVRYADDAAEDSDEYTKPITAAAPAPRYVQLAQLFDTRGYIFSICNPNWAQAMENIADVVKDNVRVICLE